MRGPPYSLICVVTAAGMLLATALHAQTREHAVAAAREGRYEEAIAMLRGLALTDPDPRVGFDLAVVLAWAGRSREATEVFEAGPRDAPAYVRAAMIGAYRDQRRFDEAERLAADSMRRDPTDPQWPRLRALALADAGRVAEAEALLAPLLDATPTDADAWLARGYASRRGGDRYAALRAYGEARRLRPDDSVAAAAVAELLLELGAPFGAAEQLGASAPLAVRARQAASTVRWGAQVVPRDPARRFEGTDAALARLDALIAEAAGAPRRDAELLRQLRGDRAVALRQRERWAEALAAIDALRAEGTPIPLYVRQAEADALLALRRPREARLAYAEVTAADPDNRDAIIGRFFAEVEDEDFGAAFATVDALAAREGPARRLPRDPEPEPNADWLDAQILAAMARNYADMNAESWQRLYPLAAAAPAIGYLRSNLGNVAAARGWPRRADEEVRIAESLAPDDLGVRAAVADSAMRRRDWPEARRRIADLAAGFPGNAAAQRLQRNLAAHDMWELRASFLSRDEKGSAASAPGSGIGTVARLYSPPIAERWRAVAAAERFTATPPERRAVRNSYGAGAELRLPDLTVEALGWSNTGSVSDWGASLGATWTPDDHWTLGANAERFAPDTPLRALLYDITANAFGGWVRYAWHESLWISAGVRGLDFSDGNRRRQGRVVAAQRIVDTPHFDLTLRPEAYASSNSLVGAPYFNPERDLAVAIALDGEHVLWRKYERAFGQRLVGTIGGYWQKGFPSGGIGGVRYEQAYRRDPFTEVRYGVEWSRRPYDGVQEQAWIFFVNLAQRF